MKPKDVADLLKLTGIVALIALLLASGLWVAGILQVRFWPMVEGIVLFSVAIGILLLVDRRQHQETDLKEITFASMLYMLLFRRAALLSLFFVAIVGVVAVTYMVLSSLFNVEYDESRAALKIGPRFGGQSTYYYTVHPYGWQNTGITLKKGDRIEVSLTGQVSPGYLKNLKGLEKFDDDILQWSKNKKSNKRPANIRYPYPLWPFTGPEGYNDAHYREAKRQGLEVLMPSYLKDDGLTVRGLPHNTVVAIILPDGREPNCATTDVNDEPTPGYHSVNGSTDPTPLLILSAKAYPITHEANETGLLWITTNDADAFRWDNAGAFFLRLKTL